MSIKSFFQVIRLPFLILTPICIFLGVSLTISGGGEFYLASVSLVLVCALMSHLCVNVLNEYEDYKSGLDHKTIRTPFSGGSGALPENPYMAKYTLTLGLLALAVIILIGGYLVFLHGMALLLLGVLGLIIILFYTSWINKHPLLCLVAPGLGFGIIMIFGTLIALKGDINLKAFLAAFIPFLQINNLLLLNQYPDIIPDQEAGRRHFPIAFGVKKSNLVYGIFASSALLIIIFATIYEVFPKGALLAILPAGLPIISLFGAVKYGEKIGSFHFYLAMNVMATLLTPLALGISFLF